ncbi:uncharacterized protein LOC112690390 isoform X2 [Sipha flava]|uniref:Uncharacterized protein LOC112690390 isoform X2 n=1 Tax=Sipha flava TaxID=143950 RepID=A0A8B8GBN3_9HEMI|nr:uncharacterized protein LOC112690390 isoform X2 [Sipha flava]
MREDEEVLDMLRPIVKSPSHLKGHELDLWHKEQNRMWQKTKKKKKNNKKNQFIKLRIDGIVYIEEKCNKIEGEMPISDENIKSKSYTMSNSKFQSS